MVFLMDLILNLVVVRIQIIISKKKHLLLEIILQLVAIIAYVKFYGGSGWGGFENGVGIAMTIYFARLLRIADFFTELRQF